LREPISHFSYQPYLHKFAIKNWRTAHL